MKNEAKEFLTVVDRRTQRGRRWVALREVLARDLGGVEALDTLQRLTLDHAAALHVMVSEESERLAQGEDVDFERYQRLLNTLRRVEASLGIGDKARAREDDVPDLDSYLREKFGEAWDQVDAGEDEGHETAGRRVNGNGKRKKLRERA